VICFIILFIILYL